jgi:protein-S-isoprenylcysteine O-methyltransferase Ste14
MNPEPLSRRALFWMTLARFGAGVIVLGCLLFLPAGTFAFWQAWVYLGLLFVPAAIVGAVLLVRDPQLLERRMRRREKETAQKRIVAAASIVFIAVYLISGFDRRWGWSSVPPAVVLAADILILLGYLLFILTIRENRYASRAVAVEDSQVVISTGVYALVRHPMYVAITLMFGLSPLALGSYWALVPAVLVPVVLVLRINDEERLLRGSLAGYEKYCRKVKYRLVPFIW